MRPDHEQEHLRELTADLKTGRMTRGQFVSKALAMGISLTAAAKLLDANPALAHNKAEQQLQAAGKTYQYWTPFAGADGPHMKLMTDVYNSKNPGTYFNFVRVGGGYETKMTSAAISKTLPDVAAYRADWIPDAVARGIFEPIDDIASQNNISATDYQSFVWRAGQQGSHRYAIPLDTHVATFFYNKSILAKAGLKAAPTNKAEFESAIAAVNKTGAIAFPISINWPLPVHWSTFFWQMKGELWSSDNQKATFNTDPGVRALQYIIDLVNKQHASPKNITDEGNISFLNKKAAMWLDGIWWLQGVKDARFDYGAGPVPYLFDTPAAWTGSHQMVLPAKTRTAADRLSLGKFISYIVQNSAEWSKGGQVPANATVRASAAFKAVQPQATIATEEQYLHLVGPLPGQSNAFYSTFGKYAGLALQGKLSAKQALDQATTEANKILVQARSQFSSGGGSSD